MKQFVSAICFCLPYSIRLVMVIRVRQLFVLNLILSPLLIMSSHSHASASDSFIDYWCHDWL